MRKILFIVLSLVVLMANFVMPLPVYAAVDTLTVSGDGTENVGSNDYPSGAHDYTDLNSDDGDASYLRQTGAVSYKSLHITDSVVIPASISNVALNFKVRYDGAAAAGMQPYAYYAGTRYMGTYITTTGVYTLYTQNWAKNPLTGADWRVDDSLGAQHNVNNWEFGLACFTGALVYGRCTYMYLGITYTAATSPTTTTSAATDIDYSAPLSGYATLNGVVTDDGGTTIDYYGFVWQRTADGGDGGNPGNVDPSNPPAGWANGWKSAVGDYGENSFSHQITGMTNGVTYWFRAASHNSVGWAYGSVQSFRNIYQPSITTVAASSVGSTTARLNANLTDGGLDDDGCTIRFAYVANAGAPHANYAAIVAAGGTVVTCASNYTTGQLPYYDISSLAVSTTYNFATRADNSYTEAVAIPSYGLVLSFTTESGVYVPTNFKGIPTSTTLSLQWTKGVGSDNTLVRYKLGSYPTSVTDGTQAYFDNQTSVVTSGLTAGTTYYIRAWGESGGTYSSTSATLILTTLAAVSGGDPLPTVTTPDFWFQSPDYTTIAAFPLYATLNWGADCFGMPRGTFWFLLAIGLSIMGGVIAYSMSTNLLMSILATAFLLIIGVFAKLVPMWLLLPYFILAFTGMLVGERR